MTPTPVLDCGCGGGGSFDCTDLNACSIDALEDVDTSGASDGDVLTLDSGIWVPAASSGGGIKAFGESRITGGNGASPQTRGAVTGPAFGAVTIDAAEGDLIECSWNTITFGGQTFYTPEITSGTPRTISFQGWYKTVDFNSGGEGLSCPVKFLVQAADLTAGQITIAVYGSTTGGAAIVIEGSLWQVTNFGPVGA